MEKLMKLLQWSLFLLLIGLIIFLIQKPINKEKIVGSVQEGKLTERLSRGEFAFYNAEFEFKKTRNPESDAIPANIRALELEYASSLPESGSGNRSQNWEHRGPFNVGGRMLCLAFDVEDESHVFAGSASGGMWQSADGGQSWAKATPPDVEQSATCIAQDTRPGKTNIWYYGTGELLSTTDRNVSTKVRTIGIGNGIFKTTDNGNTWEPLPYTLGGNPGTLSEVFQGVWRIVTDPVRVDKDIVYAACYGAIMRSEDGGNTWAIALGDLANKSFCTDVAITSEGILYAALSSYTSSNMRPGKAGFWRSEDGLNWTNITPDDFPVDTRVMKIALAPSDQNVLYLMTEYPSSVLVPYNGVFNSDNTFWKYTDGSSGRQGAWENRTEFMYGHGKGDFLSYPNALISYGGYTFTLAVKPDDENVVIIGGMSAFRSDNGFADSLQTTWIGGDPYDMDSLHMLHPDQHGFTFLPSNPEVFYAACDGGILRTEDIMAENIYWNRMNQNLVSTQFYSVSVDQAGEGDNIVLGGLQDNCWYYSPTDDPGDWWFSVDLYYDGFSCKVADYHDYAIVAAYSGNIWTTRFDEGLHTKDIYYQTPDTLLSFYNPIIGSNPIFSFYCNFILDPNNNETFYLPTINGIWRKDNMKAASMDTSLRNVGWTNLSNINLSESVEISALTISKTPANRLYYGTDNGHVYRLDGANSGNPTPVEITSLDFPVNAYVACIDVNQANADKIFAVFSNYGIKSIFYSDDGGMTWSHQGGNLEENPDGAGAGPSVRWVKTLDNSGNQVYYAGTSVGLFNTTWLNGDSTVWSKEGAQTIGNVMVDMIDARESDGFVAIATHGNGIYSVYYDPTAEIKETSDLISSVRNYPNPFRDKTTIEYVLMKDGNVYIQVTDISGKKILTVFNGKQQAGLHKLDLEATNLTPALYLLEIRSGDQQMVMKILKDIFY
ncbi:MAG: T9SS type A sorting domain-containing protein [Bacteroidales bacterium]|nr:T9SS type A sorting domain-containing protein [Bacteroidales bacterium]